MEDRTLFNSTEISTFGAISSILLKVTTKSALPANYCSDLVCSTTHFPRHGRFLEITFFFNRLFDGASRIKTLRNFDIKIYKPLLWSNHCEAPINYNSFIYIIEVISVWKIQKVDDLWISPPFQLNAHYHRNQNRDIKLKEFLNLILSS